MKLTKNFSSFVLSVFILSACGQTENISPVNGENKIQSPIEKVITKHEAVDLPVIIYMDSEYDKLSGKENTFTRRIIDTEIKDFDESTEIEFLERSSSDVRRQHFDLQNDYKLLVITMSHELTGDEKLANREAFMLNAGSGLVMGDDELAMTNEFLSYQQEYVATDYRVGKTIDETGDIFLAIPNEFADNENLQLKVLQKLDDENKHIYVDIQN